MKHAADRLRRFLEQTSVAEFARDAGVHRSFLWRIARGRALPSVTLAVTIERLTGRWEDGPIRVHEWAEAGAPCPGDHQVTRKGA